MHVFVHKFTFAKKNKTKTNFCIYLLLFHTTATARVYSNIYNDYYTDYNCYRFLVTL